MVITKEIIKDKMLLKGTFDSQEKEKLIDKFGSITEYISENEAYIFLGDKQKFTTESLTNIVNIIVKNKIRNFQIDVKSFTTKEICPTTVAAIFIEANAYNEEIWNLKTKKQDASNHSLLINTDLDEEKINEVKIIAKQVKFARNLQIMTPNILNSEVMADEIVKQVTDLKVKNLTVKVLNKKEIEKEKMGLLLSVNKGSMYEPRVVVLEYKGNPDSNEKMVFVGKGITFDSGGYSLKPSRSMLGMKFDMSGAAIVASAVMAISQLQPKANVSAVLCITDNRVNGDASLPDSVWTSMNGKTVEINNTDAEGRLVMADGITYAIRRLNATKVLDVATLTGAILSAFGHTYTGIWSTSDQTWIEIKEAAKSANELVWRMPFNDAFAKNIKNSQVADLINTDLSGMGGSCSAAMFLKEFAQDVNFTHCDIAGTAEQNGVPTGVLIKTLTKMFVK
ncbi:M17 family metallopeptidase [Mycoplasma phocimorsus]|uniref:M17 family metallopeptidase n=1 Tax=Mycoplasma phocimorsus TaxID=3045839 RepID=UPI0024C003F2|nr:leucyl aminopeptidase family protein [Mycoplasma phocimorsus]MDJ1648243.1 leucyl aminopeptidase family protein [Mycoplasma phocimorsus]